MTACMELYRQLDPPYERFDNSMLGPAFPAELDLVSRLVDAGLGMIAIATSIAAHPRP